MSTGKRRSHILTSSNAQGNASPTHGLPQAPYALIGRKKDLEAAQDLILRGNVRLVTITGPPGVGKTRFAVELASTVGSESEDGLVLAVAYPALADVGDISVGGVWVCRITRGAGGLSLEQRVAQIERQITEMLSIPGIDRRTITISVRPVGQSAAIVVADIALITVTPEDAAGTHVTTMDLARQWARRLVAGLQRALPSATFHGF